MTNRQYLRSWERNHGRWERRAFNIVKTTVDDLYKNIPTDQINFENWEAVIRLNIPESAIRDMVLEIWRFAGRLGGEWAIRMFEQRIAKSGVPPGELEAKNAPLFSAEFNRLLAKYFVTGVGAQHIKTMNETIVNQLTVDVAVWLASNGGRPYTFRELREKIREIAGEGYPAWMAARVARTEVTAAANWATLQGAKQNKYKVQKEWISIDDRRTRTYDRGDKFDHLEMDGALAGIDQPFEQRGVTLQFPGDPEAKPDPKTAAGMVINCRCTMAIVPVRDANGRLVLNDGATIPKPAAPKFKDVEFTEYENQIRPLDYERGAVYDPETGQQLYETTQFKPSQVNFGTRGTQLSLNKVVTHNHPGGYSGNDKPWANSFSPADVKYFGYHGPVEFRAVARGRTFQLLRDPIDTTRGDDPLYRNYRWHSSVGRSAGQIGAKIDKDFDKWVNSEYQKRYYPDKKQPIFLSAADKLKWQREKNAWWDDAWEYRGANYWHWVWTRYFQMNKNWGMQYVGELYNPKGFEWQPYDFGTKTAMQIKQTLDDVSTELDGENWWKPAFEWGEKQKQNQPNWDENGKYIPIQSE